MCMIKNIFVILFSALILVASEKYPNADSFIKMVTGNITAAKHFVLPTDNAKELKLNEEHEVYDYGTYDFVIVGAGSAGSLLANRLSEIKTWKILLLEAGGPENDFSGIPGMAPYLSLNEMSWGYHSVPQKTCCLGMRNKSCRDPRGKVIGGCSTTNAKMYVRGNKADYDDWEKMGTLGWSYKDVSPYFIKMENTRIHNGDIGFHGSRGLLHTSYTEPTCFTISYMNAMQELGYPVVDYNGRHQIGVSPAVFTLHGNKIANAAREFIDPFINRKNLNVTLNAFVTKVLIDKKLKLASGVAFTKNGRKYFVRASKEVILSSGSFNTPQLLMISGIGPKQELDSLGVDLVEDLPVGKNLQDHPFFLGFVIRTNVNLFNESIDVLVKNYLKNKRPFTAAFNVDSLSFINVNDKTSSVPNIQNIVLVPPGVGDLASKIFNLNEANTKSYEKYNPNTDLIIMIVLLHPKSRGSVTLKSNSPRDFPDVDYKYFSDPENEDIETMYRGVVEATKLLETKSFKSMNASLLPVVAGCDNFELFSKPYWYCAIRHLSSTLFHPVGTTSMGTNRSDSVVSPTLIVHGTKNLRVVDAGVMPKIPSGNTNVPTYMVAEKASDDIKKFYGVKGN